MLHIIISSLSVVSSTALLISTLLHRYTHAQTVIMSTTVATTGSVFSGVLLVLGGSSLIRVCTEGMVLVLLNVTMVALSKQFAAQKVN